MKEEIEQSLEELRAKYHLKSLTNAGRKRTLGGGEDDEEDEREDVVMDTSTQTSDISTNWRLKKKMQKLNHTISTTTSSINNTTRGDPSHHSSSSSINSSASLDYKQIKQQYEELLVKKQSVQSKLQQLQEHLEKVSKKGNQTADDDDELDDVIQQGIQREIQEKIKQLTHEDNELQIKSNNLEKLLKLVTPALPSYVNKTFSPPENMPKPQLSVPSVNDVPKKSSSLIVNANDDDQAESRLKSFKEFQQLLEKEKETTPLEIEKDDNKEIQNTNIASKPSSKSRVQQGPSKLPEDSLSAPNPPFKNVKGPSLPSMNASLAGFDKNKLQDGDYIWMPPKQQKGDGKTSLNEKFGY